MTDPNPGLPTSDLHKLVTDLIGRVADLERQVAALKAERGSLAASVPYTPPTDEELHDMLHGPRGQPLLEVIEEYEEKYLRSRS